MIVCANCKREMTCKRNGSNVRFGITGNHVYAADQFECAECGAVVNVTNEFPYQDSSNPSREGNQHDVWMDS